MQASTLPPAPLIPRPPVRRVSQAGFWQRFLTHFWAYIYLGPMFLLTLVFIIYPMFGSLGYTLYQWNGIGDPSEFVGLANFERVIHDSIFWGSFLHTLLYTAVLVPVQLTVALSLALVLNNPRLKFVTAYRLIYFIPVVTSPAVVGVVVQLLLSNFGDELNTWLLGLHLIQSQIDWLGDPRYAMAVIITVGIWNTMGYNLVYFLAGLQTIPQELYEAASIDGANQFSRFLHITIPMLRAVGVVILILAILGSLQVFDLVQVLTGGGPYFATEVVNTYIYHLAFGGVGAGLSNAAQPNIGFASAASFFYGLVLLGLSLLQLVVFRSLKQRPAAGK